MEGINLIFIYNANSGTLNGYLDIAHKIISPSTYQCSLCNLTHGTFKERSSWKTFRENAKYKMKFLHIDEFKSQYGSKFNNVHSYPIVLIEEGYDLQLFISTEELNKLDKVEALMELVEKRVSKLTI